METIYFIQEYLHSEPSINSVLLNDYINILQNHVDEFEISDDTIYFTDSKGDRHSLDCIKKYFRLPDKKKIEGVNPNNMKTRLDECYIIKENFLPPDSPVLDCPMWCPGCHIACIRQYLAGKLVKR